MKICTAAGHGGRDSGAVGNGYLEKDLNLKVTLKLNDYLKAAGHEVVTYRTTDTDFGLTSDQRTGAVAEWSNREKADHFMDVHFNAGGGTGTECYYSIKEKTTGNGYRCAVAVAKEIAALGYRNRGAKVKKSQKGDWDYFGVIRDTHAPANLVECLFIDNKEDMARVDTDAIALAIAKGLCAVLCGNPVPKPAPTPEPVPSGIKVGRVVDFTSGGLIYTSIGATNGKTPYYKTGLTISKVYEGAKNPYQLSKNGEIVGYTNAAQLKGTSGNSGSNNGSGGNTTPAKPIRAGSKVKIRAGAIYGGLSSDRGKPVPSAYIGKTYDVVKVQTNKGVQEALIKQLNSWVAVGSLTVV